MITRTAKAALAAGIAITSPMAALAQSSSPTFIGENRFAIAILICVYLLPSWIAWSRKHGSKGSIIAVNLLLGWTGIGWIWAFIWSLGSTGKTVVVVNSSPVAAPSQSASAAIPVANKTVAERIADLKGMLDAGAISQGEFDLLKAEAFKKLA